MGDVLEYRVRDYIRAEQISEDGPVFTAGGTVNGRTGDYLVYREDGTYYADQDAFEALYELVPESVSEARKFTPDGKTVDEVLEFLKENPSEIDRVKDLESKGVGRKGIMEYEIR